LAEQERGLGMAEVCRKHGVSAATLYKWKAKFGSMDVSDARKLKSLERFHGWWNRGDSGSRRFLIPGSHV
jgi:hypothetical protein